MRSYRTAGIALALIAMTAGASAQQQGCPRDGTLGVGRTVEIDTTGGPGFGMQHYKAYDFLQPKEVVLTFDDGPQKFSTEMVLKALADECTKATFFSIGKMALGYPEIIREVAKAGHTIGTHTWSHQNVVKAKTFEAFKSELERGVSAVHRAVGGPITPFFRFPTLKDSPETLAHLASRNIAVFSTDIDSFDFKLQKPEVLAKSMLDKLDKAGKGIMLMHDIHKNTARALPIFLKGLREKGYTIVHMKAKAPVETLAEFDAEIEKDAKGLPQAGTERPVSSIVRTIEGKPTPDEQPTPEPPAAPATPPAAPGKGAAAAQSETDNIAAHIVDEPDTAATPGAATATTAHAAAPTTSGPVQTVPSTTSSLPDDHTSSATAPASKPLTERAKDVLNSLFGKAN